ncbi:hypothetical protein [Marinifilum sp.]|uniref:hypothetical protein n=1 Tax=Marinifilum sp. TaxID=2033137 RepID=UPI003BAA9299
MSEYNILTVLKASKFPNEGTFQNPYGGWRYWHNEVFMIADAPDGLIGKQATDLLELRVRPGDVINWLDTPISQGLRKKDGTDIDMLVYGMRKGSNWDQALEPLKGETKNMSHAYINSNFDCDQEPTFQCLTYPNNLCSCKVKEVSQQVEIRYYLKMAKLDLTDPDNVKVLGWYEIDPKIIVEPLDSIQNTNRSKENAVSP